MYDVAYNMQQIPPPAGQGGYSAPERGQTVSEEKSDFKDLFDSKSKDTAAEELPANMAGKSEKDELTEDNLPDTWMSEVQAVLPNGIPLSLMGLDFSDRTVISEISETETDQAVNLPELILTEDAAVVPETDGVSVFSQAADQTEKSSAQFGSEMISQKDGKQFPETELAEFTAAELTEDEKPQVKQPHLNGSEASNAENISTAHNRKIAKTISENRDQTETAANCDMTAARMLQEKQEQGERSAIQGSQPLDTYAKGKPVKEEPVKEEPIKEELIKEEPIKEKPIKEKPIKEESEPPLKEQPLKVTGEKGSDDTMKAEQKQDRREQQSNPKEDSSAWMQRGDNRNPANFRMTEQAPANTAEVKRTASSDRSSGIMNQVRDYLDRNLVKGTKELELQLNPKDLGKLSIRIASEDGKTQVTIMCSNSNTMKLLTEKAGEIGRIMETNLGSPTTIVTDYKEDSYKGYSEEGHSENGSQGRDENGGRESGGNRQSEEQKNNRGAFIQQLRLGLV